MAASGKREIRHLEAFQKRFVQLNRLIIPAPATLTAIGEACHKLRSLGRLDPVHPKHRSDIAIAALARQVGATVITRNEKDFGLIQTVLSFEYAAA